MGGLFRVFLALAPLALLVFGYSCLNYTKAFGFEAHVAWAQTMGAPGPSFPIFVLGFASTAVGAVALGYRVGRHTR